MSKGGAKQGGAGEETRYGVIIDQSPISIQIMSPDGRTVRVNRAWERLWGFTLEDLKDYNMLEDPQLVELGIMPYIRRGFAGEVVRIPRTLYDPDKTLPGMSRSEKPPRWTEALIYPVKDASGEIKEIVLMHEDVTARVEAEECLKESERQLQTLADAIPQLAWIAEPDGHIFWYNRRWYEYTGTTPAEMEGWGWRKVHDPAVLPQVVERWKRSLATGEPFEMEFPLRGADGEFRWFLTRVNPLRDERGNVARWFGTNTDIDELRRVREAERETREELETLNRTGRTLAAELDLQKVVQTVTDAATEIAGAQFGAFFYNVLDARGESYMLYTLSGAPREAFSNFPMPRNTEIFAPTFKGEGTVLIHDVKRDPRYGKNAPYNGMPEGHLPVTSYLSVPVVSRSGEVLGGLFFGHSESGMFTERAARIVEGLAAQAAVAIDNARLYDAAQRERAQAEAAARENEQLYRAAEESSRLKDEFLATVSHELRTPLTAILGWTHFLLSGRLDEGRIAHALETIERNARLQAQLIEDLLDVSRIITGKLRLDARAVEPSSFVEAAVESILPAAEAKGVQVRKMIDAGTNTIFGDAARLQQVVWNLLSNAVRFTPRGGEVAVKLARADSQIEISVADTGQGIAPDFLPFVFDRFRQAEQGTARRYGGLGLGLAIVRHLVEMHGGTVTAASEGEGKGATFVVKLPLMSLRPKRESEERTRTTERALQNESARPERLDGLHVLVVDDEPDARELISAVLSERGAQVSVAASAAEAVGLVRERKPDVIVSDIGMPGEDGYELISRLRALPTEQGGAIPAVALTAYARIEDRMRALDNGYQMHVSKPVELDELVAVVASLAALSVRRV